MGNGIPPTFKQPVPRTVKQTVFQGCHVEIKVREQGDGYNLLIFDPVDNHTYICPFDEEVKSGLLQQMTGVSVPPLQVVKHDA